MEVKVIMVIKISKRAVVTQVLRFIRIQTPYLIIGL